MNYMNVCLCVHVHVHLRVPAHVPVHVHVPTTNRAMCSATRASTSERFYKIWNLLDFITDANDRAARTLLHLGEECRLKACLAGGDCRLAACLAANERSSGSCRRLSACERTPSPRHHLTSTRSRTPPPLSRARLRSRSGAKTLATHAQLADAVWQDTSRVLVLANEAAADTVTHDTLVQMNSSCVPHLATKIAGILGGHIVGPNLMILNHRALGDKYCQPSHHALQRSLHAALRAADGQIVLWTGQYHSRLFDSMERHTGMDFSWLMQVARISRLSDAVDMDEIVSGALQQKTVWGANAIKAAIIRGALHIAVRVHLSYETPASVRLRADFPAMLDQLRAPVQSAPKQASVVEAFIVALCVYGCALGIGWALMGAVPNVA